MSPEDRALPLLLASFAGPDLPDDWRPLLADGLGGVCLFGSNLAGRLDLAAALTAAIREAGTTPLVAVDEEGGDVTRLHVRDGSPVLGAAALGRADDLALTYRVGAAVATDLRAAGIDLDLGPVADINSCPDNPVIGTRSFGADADLVARHVTAWVEGLQAGGVAACVKHFPGHGDTTGDSHLTTPTLQASPELLRARELLPFRAAIEAGAGAVMTSHLMVPAVDDRRPATLSRDVLRLLRQELGFTGAVVTDALDMAGVSAGRGIPEAAVLALEAGCDLLCLGPDQTADQIVTVRDAIGAAVRGGRLSEERLVQAAERIEALRALAVRRAGGGPPATTGPAGLDPRLDARLDAHLDAHLDAQLEPDLIRAARRAIRVDGVVPDLAGARVISVDTDANIAVGPGPWGLAPDLLVPPGGALPAGPLVVQVRDADRRPDVATMLATLDRDSVVVEWGWARDRTGWSSRAARLCTWGHSRPGIAAVQQIIREAGWDR